MKTNLSGANVKKISRRQFVLDSAAISGLTAVGLPNFVGIKESVNIKKMTSKSITLKKGESTFEREPLIHSYGFKGGYITRLWQVATLLKSENGFQSVGLGIQSPLWSDARVAASRSESGGNSLMYDLTEKALSLTNGMSFESPIDLLDNILEPVYEYGKKITENPDLRKTFALNALVSVDNAAWLLYAQENNITSFDELVPEIYKEGLSHRHQQVASIPSISYSTAMEEVKKITGEGYFFLKIKIGSPGSQQEMLKKDMERLTQIHKTIGSVRTPHTKDGKLPYYLDANGRYESKEAFLKLLSHAKKIGAYEQIVVVEEPFPETWEQDVSDIPVRIAADESAHTDQDALKRIQMGYKALALKPVAKTLSMTMKIAQLAHEKGIPCLCADLTVNPTLVDWNKSVAARLAPLPGLNIGLLETNGHQNYKNWDKMLSYHPKPGASWIKSQKGMFELDDTFYKESAGILQSSVHYENLFKHS
ncbi:enolase C-terminal domain-like protein [Fulvivirgaceae bacterium BMA12]|uniref:Enolase C-terminal domain-like protein n=1 Tax=Agaribacillus aureus TaxID=3051825 RepID=A0ABT8L256_9BACT|nr:enolase C-terminal domain-like protein [Fulvivirgaceae bacterium BMA12]